jgi:hypothetical protein
VGGVLGPAHELTTPAPVSNESAIVRTRTVRTTSCIKVGMMFPLRRGRAKAGASSRRRAKTTWLPALAPIGHPPLAVVCDLETDGA